MKGRVVLAMSGGVDSSTAALRLKEDGYEVVGLFMRTGAHGDDPERRSKTCCSLTDAQDARAVADRLDIPFYVLDFERDFERIIEEFTDAYFQGRTPNPCVLCNVWLKFGKLWAYGKNLGADFVATGHHARIVRDEQGRARIARAVDRAKDQSYVLSGLRRELLDRVLFPVGDWTKAQVREAARSARLPVHAKAESQEICFVPDDDYLAFVRARRPEAETAGEVVDESGEVVGAHAGFEGFTIGQRRGLGIAFGEPRYVVAIDPPTRKITIGPRRALERGDLEAERFNWHTETPRDGTPIACLAQIRSQHRAVPARVIPNAVDGDRVRVEFETPQSAITPGQLVTLYHDELVLGGGWIAG